MRIIRSWQYPPLASESHDTWHENYTEECVRGFDAMSDTCLIRHRWVSGIAKTQCFRQVVHARFGCLLETPITVGVMWRKFFSLVMASSSQIGYSYNELIEKAEAQVKTRPGLWIDLMDDLRVWKKMTDWLEVSFFSPSIPRLVANWFRFLCSLC